MNSWKTAPLGHCVDVFDSMRRPVTKKHRIPGPFPYYGAQGVVDHVNGYLFEGLYLLVAEDGENLRSRKLPIAYLADGQFWVNNHAHVLRGNAENDTRFLSYRIESLDISGYVTGSTQPKLNKESLLSIPVSVPSLPEQRAIAATLGALDDKIESNQIQVDLIPELIHNLVEEDLRTRGSRTVPVSTLGKFVNGGAYTKNASGSGRMVIRIADLNSGPGASTVYNDISTPDDKVARPGDILMSWSGSLGVYVWYRPEAIVNQHIFKVIPDQVPHWLVFDRLHVVIDSFRGIAADKATTMGHIRRSHLDTTTVELPQPQVDSGELNKICAPLWNRRNRLLRESLRLAELRDTLLPELMSGRIRVPEAREAVVDAIDGE